jgi:hypothetical protein
VHDRVTIQCTVSGGLNITRGLCQNIRMITSSKTNNLKLLVLDVLNNIESDKDHRIRFQSFGEEILP